MRRKGRVFRVKLDIPPDATEDDVKAYILDAVATTRGCYFPGDDEFDPHPMWGLDEKSIEVLP